MENLSVREKIYQMFILGLKGEKLEDNPDFVSALKNNLGGVIFFTQNIITENSFKSLISDVNQIAKIPLFLSIDQEGGRVERTLNLHNGQKYLCARDAAKKGEEFVKMQSSAIADELKKLGLNMNFAPVLDVDTNPNNPVIAERSYSSEPDDVIKYGKICALEFLKKGIIPVGKHFPGHGETSVDSHKDMPVLDISVDELEAVHIKPFKELLCNLPALMAAHINYKAFDSDKIPGSISANVLGYLRNTLSYEGLIISDDMVMGGIKGFSSVDACVKGINAGINMFIFRNSDEQTLNLIETLARKAGNGEIDMNKINFSMQKIAKTKFLLSLF